MNLLTELLKKLRKKKKLTQSAVAEYLGVDRVTYTNYELGNRKPDAETLKKLSILYGVSVDYLIGNTTKPNRVTAPELQDYGIEWVELRKEAVAAGLSAEDIKEIIRLHLDITKKSKKK